MTRAGCWLQIKPLHRILSRALMTYTSPLAGKALVCDMHGNPSLGAVVLQGLLRPLQFLTNATVSDRLMTPCHHRVNERTSSAIALHITKAQSTKTTKALDRTLNCKC